jgi:ATP/maltotriose-dependent transcriptional regulator MalT/DNA-binding SARP family transcriptional activator
MPSLAKLTRPKVHRALARERLFDLMDEGRERPLIWVTAPPGAGKTTLVSSYVEARKLSTAWYQLDPGDEDLGTFFYYLAQALPATRSRRAMPLPALSAAHLGNLPAFSRHFFRSFFARPNAPAIVAFDNYHELAETSALHGVLEQAVAEVPQGHNIVVISRASPPRQIAQLRLSERLSMIDWDTLRLSLEETRAIAAGRVAADEATVRRIHRVADGWAAGIALALQHTRHTEARTRDGSHEELADLFDYFTAHLLESAGADTREFLQITALLPSMTAAMADSLTARTDSETLLEDLHRRGMFTDRRNTRPAIYQYHDLFRTFLMRELERSVNSTTLSDLQRRAGTLLEVDGRADHAIRLYLSAKDWPAAQRAILQAAPQLLAQGRGVSVIDWIGTLPPEVAGQNDWIGYWLGVALARVKPPEARAPLERAFEAFKVRGDIVGQRVACAEILLSYMFEYAEFHTLDRWIEEMLPLLASKAAYPSSTAELRVQAAALFGLSNRKPVPRALSTCIARILALLEEDVPAEAAVLVAGILMIHLYYVGDATTGMRVVAKLKTLLVRDDVSPFARAIATIQLGHFSAHLNDQDEALRCFAQASEVAAANALTLPVLDVYAQLGLAICALERGDLATANACRRRIDSYWSPGRKIDQVASLRLQFWIACHRRQWDGALALAERQLAMAKESGLFLIIFHSYIMLGLVYAELRRHNECLQLMSEVRALLADTGYAHFAYDADLVEAHLALVKGDTAACHVALRKGLAGSRKDEFKFIQRMQPASFARLLAEALEADIETQYVTQVIRDLDVRPPSPTVTNWPWPLLVHTLGRFEVLRDGEALEFSRKAPKKTLALLKAIIALGGRNVREQALLDAFWADEEGDVAARSLTAALHRLRALLGDGNAIVQQGGTLSLDSTRVWVDVWALESALSRADGRHADAVLAIYRGAFLAEDEGEPWSVTMRERLRSKFIHAIGRHAHDLETSGRFDVALECYVRGLDADPVIEQFYQGLMRCYAHLDRKSEAIAAYRRLKQILSVSLSLKPSPSTEKLYQSLRLDHVPS